MTATNGNRRPAANETATKDTQENHCLNPTANTPLTYEELVARARRVDYAIKVLAQRKDGVVTVQLYTTLAGAEKKVARVQSRGLWASMFLVRLTGPREAELPENVTLIGDRQCGGCA